MKLTTEPMTTKTKPPPKTDDEIKDLILQFHADGLSMATFSELLASFIDSGKLELALKLIELQQLSQIASGVDALLEKLQGE